MLVKDFVGIYDAKLLRTFLPLSEAWLRNQINVLPVSRVWPRNEIDNKVTHDLLPRLARLRVLSLLNYSNVADLPFADINPGKLQRACRAA
ncbi:hypothetical protein OIU77_018365 [Salix suchowensis]|uniref:Uncharacterized protein n=1 Tax=Salix suchowensis TaxID=1278906 RepID=A0ABQ9CFB5_9ROSI|nr:hypothetical protein OIU77_018365 [Salix suchowensis]